MFPLDLAPGKINSQDENGQPFLTAFVVFNLTTVDASQQKNRQLN